MALAIKCDRCGKYFEVRSDAERNDTRLFEGLTTDGRYRTTNYDLCPDCAAEFKEWINANPKEVFPPENPPESEEFEFEFEKDLEEE